MFHSPTRKRTLSVLGLGCFFKHSKEVCRASSHIPFDVRGEGCAPV